MEPTHNVTDETPQSPTETPGLEATEQQGLFAESSEDGKADIQPEPAATPAEVEGEDAAASAKSTIEPRVNDRKQIEEQLMALKRREAELKRELAITDHPELADAIRILEGKAFPVSRIEEKMAQGLSKAEERRLATLEKKLGVARDKRAEIDSQIAALEAEAHSLGEERTRAFEAERGKALQDLLLVLGKHDRDLRAAGLEAVELVPELSRWMPEIEAMAEGLVENAKPRSQA